MARLRNHEELATYGNTISARKIMMNDLKKVIEDAITRHTYGGDVSSSSSSSSSSIMATTTTTTTTPPMSQLSCSSSINSNRRFQFNQRSIFFLSNRNNNNNNLKLSVVMSLPGKGADTSNLENKDSLKYTAESPISPVVGTNKSFSTIEENFNGNTVVEPEQEGGVSEPKRAAKIHDFCFGIPYGGIVLSGGLLSFIFSRNPASLVSGVLFGGALLGLSIFSLKVWRQGNSSLPFILGQAVLAAVLLQKNFQTYSLTKAVFPAGVNVFISAAMLCFYFYVMVSGGNPPPKKMKLVSEVS
ncbi:hypothetical protein ACFE04_030993 [Oxalis oulophora]